MAEEPAKEGQNAKQHDAPRVQERPATQPTKHAQNNAATPGGKEQPQNTLHSTPARHVHANA
eukprot:76689-Lingulodinium_polyedra.AAC.1